jgi:hypothetical protein
MKNKWEIIHEGDTDSGNPTSWALEINHEKYGKYVWITGVLDYDEETIIRYDVEICYSGNDFRTLKQCKSLASAKRWVSMNLL